MHKSERHQDICAPDRSSRKQNVTPSKVVPAMMDARDNLDTSIPLLWSGSRARVCSRRGSTALRVCCEIRL